MSVDIVHFADNGIFYIYIYSIYMNDKCRIVGINHVIDVDMPSMVKNIIQLCRKDLNFSVKGHKSKIYNKLCFPGRIMINISVVLNWFYIFLMKYIFDPMQYQNCSSYKGNRKVL